jgi:hypothetical protein
MGHLRIGFLDLIFKSVGQYWWSQDEQASINEGKQMKEKNLVR